MGTRSPSEHWGIRWALGPQVGTGPPSEHWGLRWGRASFPRVESHSYIAFLGQDACVTAALEAALERKSNSPSQSFPQEPSLVPKCCCLRTHPGL